VNGVHANGHLQFKTPALVGNLTAERPVTCQKARTGRDLAKARVEPTEGRYGAVILVFWNSYDHKFISALRVLCGCRRDLAFSPGWR
jgi:hypothetical protein